MSAEENKSKDYFWVYVGAAALIAIGVILLVKKAENDKYAPIKDLAQEELQQMNVRVLKQYE